MWNFQPAARELRGPATSQMMKPTIGKMSTNSVHNTFRPVDAPEPTMLMIAQMFRANTISPPKPKYWSIAFLPLCVTPGQGPGG